METSNVTQRQKKDRFKAVLAMVTGVALGAIFVTIGVGGLFGFYWGALAFGLALFAAPSVILFSIILKD